ncbi:hypothetical protein LY78DRAFT_409532 [Colletotrichum sublineola]|nr:hypothetical protein LY78DRAFT_409532 [Colletotrichum sublineola]
MKNNRFMLARKATVVFFFLSSSGMPLLRHRFSSSLRPAKPFQPDGGSVLSSQRAFGPSHRELIIAPQKAAKHNARLISGAFFAHIIIDASM